MDGIQQAQRAIETATSHGATWLVDHWLMVVLIPLGFLIVVGGLSAIGEAWDAHVIEREKKRKP